MFARTGGGARAEYGAPESLAEEEEVESGLDEWMEEP